MKRSLLHYFRPLAFTGLLTLCASVHAQGNTRPPLFRMDYNGFGNLRYGGHSFFKAPGGGQLGPFAKTPTFAGKEFVDYPAITSTLDRDTGTITQKFGWGVLKATYSQVGDNRIDIAMTAKNESPDLMKSLVVRVGRLEYPEIPVIEVFAQEPRPFDGGHGSASSTQRPPLVLAKFGEQALLVGAQNYTGDVATGFYTAEGTANSIALAMNDIPAGGQQTATLTLRFGPKSSTMQSLGADLLDDFKKRHPMTLNWKDRRPVGKLFLGCFGGDDHKETNINRWLSNAADVDVRTDEGKADLRKRILEYADGSIEVLRKYNAQGAITWDPEGTRPGHTFYGDPRIIPDIAPEMEYKGTDGVATIDAYFKKFEDAGLLHGICIRPQKIVKRGEYWENDDLPTAEERVEQLRGKIAYAVKRWNSKLIYIDSDPDVTAAEYQQLHREFPDILLIPEWEHPLHYTATAPLMSFSHHRATGTPAAVREMYPGAFSLNFLDELPKATPTERALVHQSVLSGDVPVANAWYAAEEWGAISEIYEPAPATPAPEKP